MPSHRYRNRYMDTAKWSPSCPGPLRETIAKLEHRGPIMQEVLALKQQREQARRAGVKVEDGIQPSHHHEADS